MTRTKSEFRHIDEQGAVHKVLIGEGKYWLANTDIELTRKQICHHYNIKNGKRVDGKSKKGRRGYSYDQWWNECNRDGSFAYNGVTDDF